MALGMLGSLGITAGLSGLSSLFGGGDDVELQDVRSGEQKRAIELLNQLATTGTGGGITLGQQFQGPLGVFERTPEEVASLERLTGLISGPEISQARQTFTDLAQTEFDPSDPTSGYASFSRALARAGEESSDILEREAAITGSRFGTAISGEKADLAVRMQEQRGQYLSGLFQQARQQQLAGAQGLIGLAGTQANIEGNIANQAAVERQLKDLEARTAYDEYKRVRSEELNRINLLQTEAERNPYLGVSSIPGSPSPFSQLANSVLGSFGQQLGGRISSGDLFGGSKSSGIQNTRLMDLFNVGGF
jgi:hypothetical protein